MSLTDAVLAGASPEVLAAEPVPGSFTALHLRVEDQGAFAPDDPDKDVRRTLHVGDVPMPELAPDEVLVAVMASSINYNTVWSAKFEPVPTFAFLKSFARQGGWAIRHDQPFHVLGSDGAGIIVRVGSGVRRWKVGDHVMVSPSYVDDQEPATQIDGMLSENQLAWGYETNYGGLAEYAVARASQLVPKPAHLTWEEAATIPACGGTAYRMLVSDRGANLKQGDIVLIWGATGGLGAHAIQLVRNGGGIPIAIVRNSTKARAARALGALHVIDREEHDLQTPEEPTPENTQITARKLGKLIRQATGGEDPHIVFEHTGQATFGISLYLARRGGTVITCGSSTGYRHQYDNRYLWMKLKRILGSHIANLHEQTETARLFTQGALRPTLSATYTLAEAPEATRAVQQNEHIGKIGILCLAPRPGLGITAPQLRDRLGDDPTPLQQYATTPIS